MRTCRFRSQNDIFVCYLLTLGRWFTHLSIRGLPGWYTIIRVRSVFSSHFFQFLSSSVHSPIPSQYLLNLASIFQSRKRLPPHLLGKKNILASRFASSRNFSIRVTSPQFFRTSDCRTSTIPASTHTQSINTTCIL